MLGLSGAYVRVHVDWVPRGGSALVTILAQPMEVERALVLESKHGTVTVVPVQVTKCCVSQIARNFS